MKKRIKALGGLLLMGCAITSCSTWHDAATVRKADPEYGIIVQPMVIEIDSVAVSELVDTIIINGNLSDENKPSIISEALVKCKEKHNFDILISPTYNMYMKSAADGFSYVQVIISGYPAYFKRIRPATRDDEWMIPFYNRNPQIDNFIQLQQ